MESVYTADPICSSFGEILTASARFEDEQQNVDQVLMLLLYQVRQKSKSSLANRNQEAAKYVHNQGQVDGWVAKSGSRRSRQGK